MLQRVHVCKIPTVIHLRLQQASWARLWWQFNLKQLLPPKNAPHTCATYPSHVMPAVSTHADHTRALQQLKVQYAVLCQSADPSLIARHQALLFPCGRLRTCPRLAFNSCTARLKRWVVSGGRLGRGVRRRSVAAGRSIPACRDAAKAGVGPTASACISCTQCTAS